MSMKPNRIVRRFLLSLVTAACSGDDSTEPPRPKALTPIGGVQQGVVGTELPAALVVLVTDARVRGMPGIAVTWQASAGTLSTSTVSTDANGYASTRWTLGTVAGPQYVTASVNAMVPVTFNVTALPGPPTFVSVLPSSLRLEPGTVTQFFAQVGADQYGNLWPPDAVVWSATDSIVAPVTVGGQMTATRAGKALVRGTVGGMTGESTVEVTARWRAIGAGGLHTCALDELGYAFCWGDNSAGQLGVMNRERDSLPVPVVGDRRYTALSVGDAHACGLTSEYEAFCWGQNGVGQLGIGTLVPASSATPMRIGALRFAFISAAGRHTCGLTTGFLGTFGIAYCWGWEGEGQLGNGNVTLTRQPAPQLVHGGLTFRAISGGGSHTCAITNANKPYCWGNDYEGQIGDANTAEPRYRPVPTAVGGDLAVNSIAAGGAHTCASTIVDGRTLCWGSNAFGQVGDGSWPWQLTPTPPIGVPSLSAVALGFWHTCGLTAEGEAWCWGRNTDGQLGDGSTLTKSVATRVETSIRFTSLSGGLAHTCGVTANGEAYCWGAGASGELGIGARIQRTSPTLVSNPR